MKTAVSFCALMFSIFCYAATEEYGGYRWTYRILSNDSGVEIYGMSKDAPTMSPWSDAGQKSIIVPKSLGGLPVVKIGAWAFSCKGLSSVKLPASVVSISSRAFYNCESLSSIDIPKGVYQIAGESFYNCRSLKTVSIQGAVQEFSATAFTGCDGIKTVTFPGDRKMSQIFKNSYKGISTVNISEGASFITDEAFKYCENLEVVRFSDEIVRIGDEAFAGCEKLRWIAIPDNVTHIGNNAFMGCKLLPSITIPEAVTNIGWAAFGECSSVTSVVMRARSKSAYFRKTLFVGCSGIRSLELGGCVAEELWPELFFDSPSIRSVSFCCDVTNLSKTVVKYLGDIQCNELKVDPQNPCLLTSNGLLMSKDSTRILRAESDVRFVRLPTSVVLIGDYAFYACGELQEVECQGDSLRIGEYSFYKCESLNAIPDAIEEIKASAFAGCSSLRHLVVPACNLGESVFSGCTNLVDVSMKFGPKSIPAFAFANCPLERIVVPKSIETIDSKAIYGGNTIMIFDGDAPEVIGSNSNKIFAIEGTAYCGYVYSGTKGWGSVPGEWKGVRLRIREPIIISFDTGCEVIVEPKELNPGDQLGDLPLPVRNGHDFDGWYYSDSRRVLPGDRATENITICARWRKHKYLVTLVDNYVGGEERVVEYEFGSKIGSIFPETRPYYKFVAWSKDVEGNNVLDPNSTIERNVTLFAQWSEKILTKPIIFDQIPELGKYVVAIECENDEAVIYYTLDGSDPLKYGIVYSDPIRLSESATIKAVAKLDGWFDSGVADRSFPNPEKIISPESIRLENLSPWDGLFKITYDLNYDLYLKDRSFLIRVSLYKKNGGMIYFTTTKSSDVLEHFDQFRKGQQEIVCDMRGRSRINECDVRVGLEVVETIGDERIPVQSVFSAQSFDVNTETCSYLAYSDEIIELPISMLWTKGGYKAEKASIFIDNELMAVVTQSGVYPLRLKHSWTNDVKCVLSRMDSGNLVELRASICVTNGPVIAISPPGPSILKAGDAVSLICDDDDAVIHYTVDGSMPTIGSMVYSDPILINERVRVVAVAVQENGFSSLPVWGEYALGQCNVPGASVETGHKFFEDRFKVELYGAEGDEIRYTVDGTVPNANSQLYSDGILVSGDATIRYYATNKKMFDSDVGSLKLVRIDRPVYNVTFIIGESNVVVRVPHGACVTSPKPSMVGYYFKGWDGDTTLPIVRDVTFRAEFEKMENFHANVFWLFDEESGVLTISGENGMENLSATSSDGWKAFRNSICAIKIEEGVTAIGNFAFADLCNVTSVVMASSVTRIGRSSFSGCVSLRDIEMPLSLVSIEAAAFKNCKMLDEIEIPTGVAGIEYQTFYGCLSLRSLILPSSVSWIDEEAFGRCSCLEKLVLPSGLKNVIGGSTGLNSLVSVVLPAYCVSYTSSMEGPGRVATLFPDAYQKITDVKVCEGVTKIADRAFFNCASLQSIALPESVVYIGKDVFKSCPALSELSTPICEGLSMVETLKHVTICGNAEVVPDGLFSYCSALESVELPECVKEIGYEAFCGCRKLKSIQLPQGLLTIGEFAFSCTSIGEVKVPDGVEEISDFSFWCCDELSILELPSGVKRIGVQAFNGCICLNEIQIPKSVEVLADQAFNDCENLMQIIFKGSAPKFVGDAVFAGVPTSCNIYISVGSTGWGSVPGEWNGISIQYLDPPDVFVTLHSNFDGDESVTVVKKYGTVVDELPVVMRDGFEFEGWFTAPKGGEKVTVVNVEGAASYYAHWKVKVFRVVFDANYLGGESVTNEYSINTLITALPVLEREGFVFEGWFNSDDVKLDAPLAVVSAFTAYAKWSVRMLFHIGGEGVRKGGGELVQRGEAPFNVEFPQVESLEYQFEFLGWAATDGGQVLYPPSSVGVEIGTSSELFAVWQNRFKYEVAEDGTATIVTSGKIVDRVYIPANHAGDVVIPERIDGYLVTVIGEEAFSSCSKITSVSFPAGLKEIRKNAFQGCGNIRAVYASSLEQWLSLKFIDAPFSNRPFTSNSDSPCKLYLAGEEVCRLVIPEGIRELQDKAFLGCEGITSVSFPNSLEVVGDRAFYRCRGLEEIRFDSVESVGDYAFASCENLRNVSLPDSIREMPSTAFSGTSIKSLRVPCMIEKMSESFPSSCSTVTNASISEMAAVIGANMFKGCSNLQSVDIPIGVTEIGEKAFYDNKELQAISIPMTVKRIGLSAFENCKKLKEVVFSDGIEALEDYSFANCESIESMLLPDSVTSIGEFAFKGCYALHEVNIPLDLQMLPEFMFLDCKMLSEIVVPGAVKRISDYAFSGCTNLSCVELCEGVEEIGKYVFKNCRALRRLTFPSSLKIVDATSVAVCENLEKIFVDFDNEHFSGVGGLVLDKTGSELLMCAGGVHEPNIPKGVKSIENCVFEGRADIHSIRMPESLEYVGTKAFYGCSSLVTITIPQNVTYIASLAFARCENLSAAYFDGDRPSVGSRLFDCVPNCIVYVNNNSAGWGAVPGSWQGCATAYWEKCATIQTLGDLEQCFGSDSEVVGRINTEAHLASFNKFLESCGVNTVSDMSAGQKEFAYKSYRLSDVSIMPHLFVEEPCLKIEDLVVLDGNLEFTITLKDGVDAIAVAKDKLLELIRVGTSIDAINKMPDVVSTPAADGTALTFRIAKPIGNQGFVKVLVE